MDRWDSAEALRLIERHRVTHTHAVPTQFRRLLALPEDVRARFDPSSLRCVIHSAAPCPPEIKRAMIDWLGPVIVEYYAATEGGGTLITAEAVAAQAGLGRAALAGLAGLACWTRTASRWRPGSRASST